jgi:ATP-dependent RNA helicase RhlE
LNFREFNLDNTILDGLDAMGYEKPTPIQEQAIPVILSNKDLIACAQTGTGKTAAYILPILQKILHAKHRHLNTMVIAPTRELAMQIDQQIEGFAYFVGVSSLPIYGGGDGTAWDVQKKALEKGADIIIATPGRLIAQLQSGSHIFDHLEHLVLDEADRMLDMGFYEDIIRIMSYLPERRQTLLFSATMPPKIRALAGRILKDPVHINIAISKPAEGILQQAYLVYDDKKVQLIKYLLKQGSYQSVIIFVSTKDNVKKLNSELKAEGLKVKAFHSDLEQAEREAIMLEFKGGQLPILIGTDILSRGIDVEGIDLVINFDSPRDPEDYVHRIGRTARAESTGTAITFINEKDQRYFFNIENMIGTEIPKLPLPEFLGRSPIYQPEAKIHRSSDNRNGGFRGKRNPGHHSRNKNK